MAKKKECNLRINPNDIVFMNWLRSFMSRYGLCIKDIALMGVSFKAPTMYHWMHVDDCPLSSAIKLMDELGYIMEVDLEPQTTENDINIVTDFAGEAFGDKYGPELLFLRRAIHAHGYTPKTLAEAMMAKGYNIDAPAIAKYIYGKTDIRMARLYQFAEAMNTKVIIKMHKK